MPDRYRPITASLRSRLLLLTMLFVFAFEAILFLPAIAFYRLNYIEERLVAAQIAALSLEEAPRGGVSLPLEKTLLESAGVKSVIVMREGKSLMLGDLLQILPNPDEESDTSFDLRGESLAMLINDAIQTLKSGGNRTIRVMGEPQLQSTRLVEITLDEGELFTSMSAFAQNMLIISIIISLLTGLLVYLSLHFLLVRPMRRIKDSIVAFRQRPEAWTPPKSISRRRDEIGVVDRELARMQEEVKQSLRQKTRLAELGEAVAKINHDLRNILATTLLASESLSRVDHPHVQRISGRLIGAVNRATELCERTLRHGRADEPEPEKREVNLREIFAEVTGTLGLLDNDKFDVNLRINEDLTVFADGQQLHRVLMNICRNAAQVQGEEGKLDISADRDMTGTVHIRIRDYGPGIPEKILPNLFKPFQSSSKGGTGLGLAIARDLILAHGGQVGLEHTGPDGTAIIICLPGDKSE